MSSSRKISDPSKLHLKKELTQITKIAKVLRDPATTSSWKSPLTSSRSVVPPPPSNTIGILSDPQVPTKPEKEKKVFLYNWKTHKTSIGNNKSGVSRNTLVEDDDVTSWIQSSDNEDYVSDARNLMSPGFSKIRKSKKKKKKSKQRLEFLSQQHHHHQLLRDDESEETEDFVKVSSPLLLKLKYKSRSSSKFLRGVGTKQYDSTHTPALFTSRNPSTVRSWENDFDDDDDDNLDIIRRQGCGIPFYRNKKHRGRCRSCCSPSFSDTLRKTGTSILCGSQSMYRRHRNNKHKLSSKSSLGVLPLLKYRGGDSDDDDLSTDFGEIDLEARSRLDGRRWSTSCMSQEENIESLSEKYRPMFFDELIGQSVVVQSLTNALKKGKIAHVYLFQGPNGTGKTSTARIFSAALNCDAADEEMKPCGYCKECSGFMSGKSSDVLELNASKKNGAEKVKYLLKKLSVLVPRSSPRFKVFVIDECHLLPSRTWLSLLKFLENPLEKVVFVCITNDLENIPRSIQSRCQKYLFDKLRDDDIVLRLRKIASEENLDAESRALNLIALNADGSLREAETMLDQLSLMGKRITVGLVNELVGVVSDDMLLELLELTLSSDTAETVKKARELLDLGAEPIVMMSQLASLIMDIIAGAYKALDDKYNDAFLDGRNLSEADMERLKHALKFLSEAEKQLRDTTDRSTWFIATLLQLGLMTSPGSSSRRHSSRENPSSISREVIAYKQRSESPTSSHDGTTSSAVKLNDIWIKCIDRCHSKTLKQLLYSHGTLLSISEVEGILVAYIAFGEREIKSRAERFLSSITNSVETVLRRSVEVRIVLLSETEVLNSKETRETALTSSSESEHEIPMSRIESIIQEQRLETEWLQRSTCSQDRLKPEKNQVLPREETDHHHQQPNNGVKDLKICEMIEFQENQTGKRTNHCHVSPSLLHGNNFANNKDNLYETGSGRGVCSLLFCWNTQKSPRTNKIKGTCVRLRRSRKKSRFALFSGCAKLRK